MSELNINELPFELLVKVFRFLDFVNLKKATRTCKLWNNIIESEWRWSLKLNFDYEYSTQLKMKYILATNRKIGSIEVSWRHFNEDVYSQMHRLFQRHGFNVVKLTISSCRIENSNGFAEFLRFTPNLKHAEIFYQHDSNTNTVSDLPMDYVFPHLKKLKRFISSQETLTSLTLLLNGLPIAPLIEKWNVPFRLTHCMITCSSLGNLSHTTSLLRFVKSQTESLTDLELGSCVPNSVYECVFSNMLKLNPSCVRSRNIPMDNDFYNRLEENRSIHTIKLRLNLTPLEYRDYKFIGKFLKKLPNVRNLILPHCDRHTLIAAARNLPQLESLCIESLDSYERSILSVKFPNLKELHIRHLKVRIKWSKFTKKHPGLTILAVEKMERNSFLCCGDIERITTNVDLRHLRLGVGIVADERFLEIIRTKGTDLTLVDVPLDDVHHYF